MEYSIISCHHFSWRGDEVKGKREKGRDFRDFSYLLYAIHSSLPVRARVFSGGEGRDFFA